MANSDVVYIVISKDTGADGVARYTLGTRQTYFTRQEAEAACAGDSPSRMSIAVDGRFFQLRRPVVEATARCSCRASDDPYMGMQVEHTCGRSS